MIPRLDWNALIKTSYSLGMDTLPETLPEEGDMDDEFLQALHHVLMEIRVVQGQMQCDGCGHIYPIKDSIPNMLLQDTEV
ncbi:hypothetical protein SmJEL517_g02239 [Synchytrium microbalum]|uniref:Trm112p-like protein n=1 Tax=Synchytrium microbalum TaxID=1806994 RepID=A0A507C6N3_9FUNG|nr:uncharacterized protein SmJEL517_g02239 [Synchytrium microbalum]TPX35282.1 hypothetical protein SmJEL517_g02239 [Synchytrium microbalum]